MLAKSMLGAKVVTTAACDFVESGVGLTLADQAGANFFLDRRVALKRFLPRAPVTFCANRLDGVAPHFRRDALVEILKSQARQIEADLDHRLDGGTPVHIKPGARV